MRCIECRSAAVTERLERPAQDYRRFRCRSCRKQFNERSGKLLNRAGVVRLRESCSGRLGGDVFLRGPGNFGDLAPGAKGMVTSSAVFGCSETVTAELEVVVDPAMGGKKALRMAR